MRKLSLITIEEEQYKTCILLQEHMPTQEYYMCRGDNGDEVSVSEVLDIINEIGKDKIRYDVGKEEFIRILYHLQEGNNNSIGNIMRNL